MLDQWKIEKRKISELVQHSKNPRFISQEKFEELRRSIENYGLWKPIRIKHTGEILGGNQTLKAILEKCEPDYEVNVCVPPREMTDREYDAVLLLDNHHYGEFDLNILASEFDEELLEELNLDIKIPELIDPVVEELNDDNTDIDSDGLECPKCGYLVKYEN